MDIIIAGTLHQARQYQNMEAGAWKTAKIVLSPEQLYGIEGRGSAAKVLSGADGRLVDLAKQRGYTVE